MLAFIDWQPAPELLRLGSFAVRWYGLSWVVGIVLAYLVVQRIYALQGIDPARNPRTGRLESTGLFDPLLFYCFIGVLLGARLVHCIFYDPQVYLTSGKGLVEMLLPIKFTPDGNWHLEGYSGLASHGGAAGLFLALLLYIRRTRMKAWTVLDAIALAAPITSCLIRLGNLMNSEIIGQPTSLPWGFIFHTQSALVDGQLAPRHPAQLYEALFYLVFFLVQWGVYLRTEVGRKWLGTGWYFGCCLAAIFAFRFFVEFLKEVQGGADDGSTWLNMGQMLSIPFVFIGLWCMFRAVRKGNEGVSKA
jgi:prolipoprotein diacylglyceryl transferase